MLTRTRVFTIVISLIPILTHNEYIYFAPSRVGDYEDQNDLT